MLDGPFLIKTAVLSCAILLFSLTASAQPQTRQLVRHPLPPAAKTARPIGLLPASTRLTLAIGLPLRNQAALHEFLDQIYDPASANYHHYLTPQEFAALFGPAQQDYETLKAFAAANHLKISSEHSNRMLLEVNGTVGDIERAFHTILRTYQHPKEARTFYAPDVDPSLDLAVPVLSIAGLDNYSVPRPRLHAARRNAAPNGGSGPFGSYAGNDFRAAYAPDSSLTGVGQSLGLLQFDGYDTNDIVYYETNAGLPVVTLTNVLLNGATGVPSGNGGEVEVCLDIEMAISMAPGLSRVIVYEAPNGTPFDVILNRMATDNLAHQLSCSWFLPAAPADATADQIFQQMAAQGQSFFNASGDADAYTGLIGFPSDNPYITQVGGTTLGTTGSGGGRTNEIVWNDRNGTGSGGGISTQYPIPAWQTNFDMTTSQGSTTMRNVPDVAMVAQNIYERVDGMDTNVEGTSAAAPLWAGFTALVNQQASSNAQPPVGFLNPLLSTFAAGPFYSNVLYDITVGNNTNGNSPNEFFAVSNYDLCTGWGTPNGQTLINALAPLFTIAIPANATKGNGVLPNAGHIQLPNTNSTNIVVALISSNTNKATVPATVTIPTGQSSASFDITIIDNGVLDGTQPAKITAYVPGYGINSATMQVFDNQSATLQVYLPATASEGQGTVTGVVACSSAPAADVSINLSSSDTNEIQVPATVVLPAGQTSVPFIAAVIEDDKIDGSRSVTITAHEQNWTDGSATITVYDDISLNLSVTLPASAMENSGTLSNAGVVSIAGTLATNLTVTLVSGNTNKLVVPASIIILAGQLSNTFNLTFVENPTPDGNHTVSVTASAPGFTNGTASMLVIDDKTPPTPADPRPADTATNVQANTNLSWSNGPGGEFIQNGGFESGTFTNWSQKNTGAGAFVVDDGTYEPPGPDMPNPPYAGSYCAISEQSGGGTNVLYQDITLPTNVTSAILYWTDRIRNYATQFTSNQYFHVEIRDTNNTLLQTAFSTKPGDPLLNDWTNRMFDLASYAGRSVRIAFVERDSLYYFNVYLDNISVQVSSTAPGISNDVYFGTNSTPGPAEFQGNTTNTTWPLQLLAPQTTYYWQIVARKAGTNAGPVWQFTTAGVDHFAWSPISSLQYTDAPFAVTIIALDAFNQVVSNFNGPANLSSAPPNSITPDVTDNFTNGTWTGSISLADRATNAVLIADDGAGHVGSSNPFNVAPPNMAPVILTPPASQQAEVGATITFTVEADGTPYLQYQWLFNDTNAIAGATNSTLTLTNVQSTNAGNYSVTVTNLYGSVTSYDATLQIFSLNSFTWGQIPSPQFVNAPFTITIVAQDMNDDTFTNFAGTVFLTCTNGVPIQPAASGSFTQGVWTGTLSVSHPGSNLVFQASDGSGHLGLSYPIDVVNPPALRAANLGGGTLQVSWPAVPSGFSLQSSPSLSPAAWTAVGGSPTLTNGQYIQSIPFTGTNQFFRLQFSGP